MNHLRAILVAALFILLLFVLMLIAAPAHAADRLVRIFLATNGSDPIVVTGGTVSGNQIRTLLFLSEPCPLDIVGKEHMRRAWQVAGAYQVGCWYPTLDDEYTYINGAGELFHHEGIYWQSYARGVLHPDGTVTVTEPDFDSSRFFFEVTQEIRLRHARGLGREEP
jgi:hypothetical protein